VGVISGCNGAPSRRSRGGGGRLAAGPPRAATGLRGCASPRFAPARVSPLAWKQQAAAERGIWAGDDEEETRRWGASV
jgi:hypothetical protein